jgi:hypothetical protein
MTQGPAPIALFAYSRPDHTRRCLDALKANTLAGDSDLHLFSDGPKNPGAVAGVAAVRDLIRGFRASGGFKSITVTERETNLGLAKSIISGVTDLVGRHGRVIVVEDDLVSSQHFLRYMNDGLNMYADQDAIASIHAYIYPVKGILPETFFLKGADCWGWATWKRAWDLFEPDGGALLTQLRGRGLTHAFDRGGMYPYTRMLEDQIAGKNDSWAVRWYASAFLKDKLTLYPGRSLVHNIGNDALGTHSIRTEVYNVDLSADPIRIAEIPIVEDPHCVALIEDYLRSTSTSRKIRFFSKLRSFLRIGS